MNLWVLSPLLVISIHAAREGGDFLRACCFCAFTISIHAAREGGDPALQYAAVALAISIHAAREGGDKKVSALTATAKYFNPRRP